MCVQRGFVQNLLPLFPHLSWLLSSDIPGMEPDGFADSNMYVDIPCPLSNFLASPLRIFFSNDWYFLSEICSLSLTVSSNAVRKF